MRPTKSLSKIPRGLKLFRVQICDHKHGLQSRAVWRRLQTKVAQDCLVTLKPHFAKLPIRFSVAHKHNWVVVVAAFKHKFAHLGIDCEQIISDRRAQKLSRRILTPSERRITAKSIDFAAMLTRIFALKEAAYKALPRAIQKNLGFQNFEITKSSNRDFHVFVTTKSGSRIALQARYWRFEGYILALVYGHNTRSNGLRPAQTSFLSRTRKIDKNPLRLY